MGADVLRAYSTFQAARHGQLQQQAAAQAAILNNPQVRAGLVNNPQLARYLGVTGQQGPLPTAPSASPNQVNVPQFAWQPNLPPMDPITGLKAAQGQAGLDLQQTDPTTFRVANDAGTPEDVGAIVKRAGPQGLGNVVARTGGLGMFQMGMPQQILDLGNGQYGITDPKTGGIARVGTQPGAGTIAAAEADAARQRAARSRLAGPQGLSQPTAPPQAQPTYTPPQQPSTDTTSVQTPRGPMTVPTAMQDAANVAPPAQTPPTPTTTPFGGTAIPFHQLDPNAPMAAVIQSQQPAAAFPSPAPQGAAPSPPPQASPQQMQPYQLPPPTPGQVQPPQDTYNPFLGDFSSTPPPGGSVTQMRTTDKESGVVTTQVPTGPKLDAFQLKAYALNGNPDVTKLSPDGVRYLLDQDRIAEARKASNAALLQGTASEETARIANIMSISQALSELRWMGPGIYQYVGKTLSTAGAQRGLAQLSVSGDPGYEHVKSLTSQIRLLAFTFGGQQLTDTEAARVDAMIPQITDSPAAFKAKAKRTANVLQRQMEILLAGRGARLAPSAVQNIQDTYQKIKIIPPSETPEP